MNRIATCVWLISMLGPGGPFVRAQEAASAGNEPNPDHLAQLANCRAGIVDPEARPDDRRRWIDTLLAFDTPQARGLVVELLQAKDHPAAQQALCDVIADRARRDPDKVDSSYIDPLVDLLDASSESLRTAAARALASFPGAAVPARLGALAARDDVAMVKRLAAIDALAAKVDRREVVQELMGLLDAGEPEITDRVTRALEPASRDTIGGDSDRWKAWWAKKSKLSLEAWLTDRLAMYRERYRERTDAFDAFRLATTQRQTALAQCVADFQRDVFRGLTQEQQEGKLADWLSDSLPEVRRGALLIIRARIADEGQKPSGKALSALLHLLEDDSPALRRETLLIVQNLDEPDVVGAVLARLDREEDPTTRHAIFKTIGKLDSVSAVPALIREIAAPDSPHACVREAATALGQVAPKLKDPEQTRAAVTALKHRYEQLTDQTAPFRAALLSAMAGVAAPSFSAEFLGAIESNEPAILRPAILGLMATGDGTKLPRLRALTADADPLVRQASLEAVAQLGGEDGDMERVLTRLNPTIEANERVRDTAWQAFGTIARKRPVSEQVDAAQRLRETPDLEARYLLGLLGRISGTNGTAADTETVRDRLGALLVSQGKYAEAVPHLRSLFESRADHGADDALDAGLRWLTAALKSAEQANIAEIVTLLAKSADGAEQTDRIIAVLDEFFAALGNEQNVERARVLLADLRTVPSHLLGDEWTHFLDLVDSRIETNKGETRDTPSD